MATGQGCSFELLGRATLVGPDGVRIPVRSKQVAAMLAILWDEGRPVRRDELAELFWGEERLPAHWAGAVRGVVAKARDALERAGFDRAALSVQGGMVRLQGVDGATTDVAEVTRLVERAGTALRRGELESARQLARDAVTGLAEPIAVEGEGDWIRRLHRSVATHAGAARRTEVEALLGLGRHLEAAAAADAAIIADPLDEVAHELLIQVHGAAGRPVAARRAQVDLARILHEELGIEPNQSLATHRNAVPHVAHLAASSPSARTELVGFLGRIEELATLRHRADEVADSGRPAMVVVEGPAGIGKTRLVKAFLEQREPSWLWGRCHAGSGVAFEPFADAFRRALACADPPSELLAGTASAGLARLVPELAGHTPFASRGDDRAAVVRDVVQTIAAMAADELMVLVIDDLQWASGDTVALLGQVLEDCAAPVLVVVTVRENTAEPGAFAELLRAAPTTVLPLEGITSDDLLPLAEELVVFAGDDWTREDLARHLHDRTGGLAFFVTELAREVRMRRGFDADAIPETVRAWIRRRVEALPEELAELLEVAAVIGIRPRVELVERCWDGPPRRVVSGLERLVRSGFLSETARAGRLAFPHQITREVVEAGIGSIRRARLHDRVATELASLDGNEAPPASLAFHLAHANPERRGEAALHGYRAGTLSLSHSAWDLADDQLTTALDRCAVDEPMLRASLLVALGRTRHVLSRPGEAVVLLDEATELSIIHKFPHHIARATLMLVGRGGRGAALGMVDAERIARLSFALDAANTWRVPTDLPAAAGFSVDEASLGTLRTALEVELAWASLFVASFEERRTLVDGALARARSERAGPSRLAQALVAQRNVLQNGGDLMRRLSVMDEAMALPAADVPAETLVALHLGRHEDLLGSGDREGALGALDDARRVAERHGHPYWRWAVGTWSSLSILVDGDPDGAEAALAECRGLQPAGSPEVDACHAVQLVAIRLHQGRAGEVVDVVRAAADAQPRILGYRAVLALCEASSGDLAAAEATYRRFADEDFATVPVDSNRLMTVAVLGEVAAALGDSKGARLLDVALAPDDGCNVVLNCYGGGGAWWGPVADIRGRLAAMLDR